TQHAIGRAVVETQPAGDARRQILWADSRVMESDVPRIRTMAVGSAGVVRRLRQVLPADRVIDDRATLIPYQYDASFWSLRQRRMPQAVIVPETVADVVAAVRVASETGVPIVPRGAGTGQTGGAIAPEGGVVVSFARMRRVVEVDRRNLQAIVEPGLVFLDLQNVLAERGLFFPPRSFSIGVRSRQSSFGAPSSGSPTARLSC